jgi:hypothetical protein
MTAVLIACSAATVVIVNPCNHRLTVRAVGTTLDFAEALKQRIVLHEGEMPQPSAPDDQQPNQQADHRDGPEVSPAGRPGTRGTNRGVEARRAQVQPKQLQAGIRRERDVGKFQLKIPMDSRAQIGSASSHVRWPFVVATEEWVAPSFNHNGRPFSMAMRCFSLREMSHQG